MWQLQIRGLVHYCHGRKQGSLQTDIVDTVLELRAFTYWSKGNRKEIVSLDVAWAYMIPKSPPPKWHILSNKTILTPTKSYLLIVPTNLGTIVFQTTIAFISSSSCVFLFMRLMSQKMDYDFTNVSWWQQKDFPIFLLSFPSSRALAKCLANSRAGPSRFQGRTFAIKCSGNLHSHPGSSNSIDLCAAWSSDLRMMQLCKALYACTRQPFKADTPASSGLRTCLSLSQ